MPTLGLCKHRVAGIDLPRRQVLVATDDTGRGQLMAADRKDIGARGPNACKCEQIAAVLQVCSQGVGEFFVD